MRSFYCVQMSCNYADERRHTHTGNKALLRFELAGFIVTSFYLFWLKCLLLTDLLCWNGGWWGRERERVRARDDIMFSAGVSFWKRLASTVCGCLHECEKEKALLQSGGSVSLSPPPQAPRSTWWVIGQLHQRDVRVCVCVCMGKTKRATKKKEIGEQEGRGHLFF